MLLASLALWACLHTPSFSLSYSLPLSLSFYLSPSSSHMSVSSLQACNGCENFLFWEIFARSLAVFPHFVFCFAQSCFSWALLGIICYIYHTYTYTYTYMYVCYVYRILILWPLLCLLLRFFYCSFVMLQLVVCCCCCFHWIHHHPPLCRLGQLSVKANIYICT